MSFRPLTYKKIYVNSQYRVSDSRSSSDFKIVAGHLRNTREHHHASPRGGNTERMVFDQHE